MLRTTWRSDNILVSHLASVIKITTHSIRVKTVVHAEDELSFHPVEAIMRNASPGIQCATCRETQPMTETSLVWGTSDRRRGMPPLGYELPETF